MMGTYSKHNAWAAGQRLNFLGSVAEPREELLDEANFANDVEV